MLITAVADGVGGPASATPRRSSRSRTRASSRCRCRSSSAIVVSLVEPRARGAGRASTPRSTACTSAPSSYSQVDFELAELVAAVRHFVSSVMTFLPPDSSIERSAQPMHRQAVNAVRRREAADAQHRRLRTARRAPRGSPSRSARSTAAPRGRGSSAPCRPCRTGGRSSSGSRRRRSAPSSWTSDEVALAEQAVDRDVQLDELLERVPACALRSPRLDRRAQLRRAPAASRRSRPASPWFSCTHRTRDDERASLDVRHAPTIRRTRDHSTRSHDPLAASTRWRPRPPLGGGEERIDKQHEAGKLTARERIDAAARPGHASSSSTSSSPTAAPTSAWRSRRSSATASSPATASSTAARSSSSRRTSPCSAARSRARTPQKICKVMDLAMKIGAPVDRPQRLGRRAHPGGRRVARRLRRHLPAQHARVAASSRRSARSWARAPAAPSTRRRSPTSS